MKTADTFTLSLNEVMQILVDTVVAEKHPEWKHKELKVAMTIKQGELKLEVEHPKE